MNFKNFSLCTVLIGLSFSITGMQDECPIRAISKQVKELKKDVIASKIGKITKKETDEVTFYTATFKDSDDFVTATRYHFGPQAGVAIVDYNEVTKRNGIETVNPRPLDKNQAELKLPKREKTKK